jgi:hypothetical protein
MRLLRVLLVAALAQQAALSVMALPASFWLPSWQPLTHPNSFFDLFVAADVFLFFTLSIRTHPNPYTMLAQCLPEQGQQGFHQGVSYGQSHLQ